MLGGYPDYPLAIEAGHYAARLACPVGVRFWTASVSVDRLNGLATGIEAAFRNVHGRRSETFKFFKF